MVSGMLNLSAQASERIAHFDVAAMEPVQRALGEALTHLHAEPSEVTLLVNNMVAAVIMEELLYDREPVQEVVCKKLMTLLRIRTQHHEYLLHLLRGDVVENEL